jgi:NADPH:quinone reductase-like Zn-dependent oxidoreductase
MRAAAIDRKGGPEVLTLHQIPVPQPKPDEVLIALDTVGVGPWDIDVRERLSYWKNQKFPVVLGVDGAGTVAALGAEVRGFKVGDAVYSYVWDNTQGGFYAEYIAVPAKAVAHVPAGVSLRDAGAMAVSVLTALQGIDDALHVRRGETVIIHGASGAVGSLALQFARLRGAQVLATASGDDGVSFVKRYGATAAVDGRHGDIRAAAHEFAPGLRSSGTTHSPGRRSTSAPTRPSWPRSSKCRSPRSIRSLRRPGRRSAWLPATCSARSC